MAILFSAPPPPQHACQREPIKTRRRARRCGSSRHQPTTHPPPLETSPPASASEAPASAPLVGFIGSQVPRNGRSSRLSAPGTPRPRRAYRARICSALRRTPVARTLRHSPVLVVLVVLLQINEGTCELAARRLGSPSGLSEKSPTVVTPSPGPNSGPNSGQYSPACTGQGQGRGGSSVHSLRGVENTLPITTHAPSSADVTYPAPDKRRTASSLQVPNPVESTLSRSFCAPRAPGDAGRPGRLAPGCPSYYMPASPPLLSYLGSVMPAMAHHTSAVCPDDVLFCLVLSVCRSVCLPARGGGG